MRMELTSLRSAAHPRAGSPVLQPAPRPRPRSSRGGGIGLMVQSLFKRAKTAFQRALACFV